MDCWQEERKKSGEVRGWLAVKANDPRRILTWTTRTAR